MQNAFQLTGRYKLAPLVRSTRYDAENPLGQSYCRDVGERRPIDGGEHQVSSRSCQFDERCDCQVEIVNVLQYLRRDDDMEFFRILLGQRIDRLAVVNGRRRRVEVGLRGGVALSDDDSLVNEIDSGDASAESSERLAENTAAASDVANRRSGEWEFRLSVWSIDDLIV